LPLPQTWWHLEAATSEFFQDSSSMAFWKKFELSKMEERKVQVRLFSETEELGKLTA
jgi:hypothetical protein